MSHSSSQSKIVLAVHGGTGVDRAELTGSMEADYRAGLVEALQVGWKRLQTGGRALDAVEFAVRSLEDCPMFNAGKGSVFTRDGRNEMDAAIMEGANKRAGAVAMVTTIKNPITAARAVMEHSPHVLLAGVGAEAFAAERKLAIVDPTYFRTERRWNDLQRALVSEDNTSKPHEWGTVGAVALDPQGCLAAATSTGGMTAKFPGRVGDTPILGAGTYADNDGCAVSGTGHGEFFMRLAVAHDIVALVKYRGFSVGQAAEEVVHGKMKQAGGEGGVIALDRYGHVAMRYNSPGLYRGVITSEGSVSVYLYET